MVEIKCEGKNNEKPVIVIQKRTEYGTTFMVKPKGFGISPLPHITVLSNGKMEVHEDSADGRSFRPMCVIGEGSIDSGIVPFIGNEGLDMAIVPLYGVNGFVIYTGSSGSRVSIPTGNSWCLRAVGTYGPWEFKTKHMTPNLFSSYERAEI